MSNLIAQGFYASGLESGSRRLMIMALACNAAPDGRFAIPRSELKVSCRLGERQLLRVFQALAEDPRLEQLIRPGDPVIRPGGDHLITGRLELPRLAPLAPAAGFCGARSQALLQAISRAGLSRAAASPDNLRRAAALIAKGGEYGL